MKNLKNIPLNYYYKVYHRVIPQSADKKDYIRGFGLNHGHYMNLCRRREQLGLPIRQDFREVYEHKSRDGYFDITGKKIISKYHPLHDKMLLDKETGKKYHIDIVTIQHDYGKIMTLCTREEGTKSHGMKEWEIFSGGDSYNIKRVKENREKYELVDVIPVSK